MANGTTHGDDLPETASSDELTGAQLTGAQLTGADAQGSGRPPGTRPSHIAFMAAPAHGHVNPSLGLVAELVERGHRVTFPTTREFAPQVADAGAAPVLYETTLPSDENRARWPEDQTSTTRMFLRETASTLARVEAAYEHDRPDAIVFDTTALQALILARRWSVPHVQVLATHVWCADLEERFGSISAAERETIAGEFDEFLSQQQVGLSFQDLALPERGLVTIARRFQYGSNVLPDCYTFVGPMLSERGAQPEWQAPDERPVLLISMGSAYNEQLELYRKCLRAFADLDWHVVLATGGFVASEELGEIPANVDVRPWVPQLRILSQADAFITALEQEKDYTEIGRLNRLFHMALYGKAPNRRLLTLVEHGLNEEERFLRFNLEAMGLGETSQEDHRELLSLVAQKKVDESILTLRNHLMRGMEVISTYLKGLEATGT